MFSTIPFFITKTSSGPAPSITYLLDVYPGASMAYSVRKLRSAYAGSALRVRRSSDNAEQDIGFIGENLDVADLATFVGSGDGFVTTWYDQSTSGVNPVQATAVKQPKIFSAGSLVTENGKPAVQFDGTNDFMKTPSATTTLQMYSVHQYNPGNTIPMGFNTGNIDYSFGLISSSIYMIADNASIYGAGTALPAYLNQSIWFGDYTAFNVLRNNASIDFTIFAADPGRPPAPAAVSEIIVGTRKLEDFTFNGKIQEQIYYPTASSNVNITNNINTYFSVFSTYDADAQAYIDAVLAAGGTLSSGDQDAINTLFVDLKTAGIYIKTVAMYPYTGNVEDSNALEAKDPAGSYSITFTGGWTFNSSGATPNGTSGWAEVNMVASSALTNNDSALLTYLGTDVSPGYGYVLDIGFPYDGNQFHTFIGGVNDADTNSYFYAYGGPPSRIDISVANIPSGIGSFIMNRRTNTDFNIWYNGIKVGTESATNTTVLPNTTLRLPAAPDFNTWSPRRHQFDWVGSGLTDAQAGNLQTIVNAFQTALGRNTY